jgi:methionyl-tRNA formyltransferase
MKVVFMGTPEFAAICLEQIINSHHEVVGVVSVPDKPAGRGQKLSQSAVAKLAIEKNIPLFQPEKLRNPEFIQNLKDLNADAFVVVAFRMLPKDVWQIPPKGTFNLHASLLPQYRGAAPINWAIINGETETGVTTFLIDEKIDTGYTLLKESVSILPEDNVGTLHDKLAAIGKEVIIKTLDGLEKGELEAQPQDNSLDLKSAFKIFKEDCKIDWTDSLENIHNKIRGLSPYPAAWAVLEKGDDKKSVKIYKGRFEKIENEDSSLQSLDFIQNEVRVKLKEGYYFIEELQPEGKKRMPAKDFINGLHEKTGWKIA